MAIYNHKSGDLRKLGLNYISLAPQVIQQIKNPDALAIWAYLQSHSEHWKVRRSQVMNHFGLGRIRYDAAIKELKRLRLYWVENIKDESNRFTDREIWVSSLPKEKMNDLNDILQIPLDFSGSLEDWRKFKNSGENQETSPRSEKPQVGNPAISGNPTTAEIKPLNKIINSNKQSKEIINDQKRERESAKPTAPPVDQASGQKGLIKREYIHCDWNPSLDMIKAIHERTLIDIGLIMDSAPAFAAHFDGQKMNNPEAELQKWVIREEGFRKKKKVL